MYPALSSAQTSNLDFLQAELVRIDVLIRRYAHVYGAERQQQAEGTPGGVALFDIGAHALLNRPLGSNWGPLVGDTPTIDPGWDALYDQALQQCRICADLARLNGEIPRLTQLSEIFGLDSFALDILLLALLPSLDPRYSTLFAYLSDGPLMHYPSVNLILNILVAPGLRGLQYLTYFASDAPLFKAQLLQWHHDPDPASTPLVSRTLTIDPAIASWLLGNYQIPSLLNGVLLQDIDQEDATNALLAAETLPRLVAALHGQSIICLYGPDQEAATATASQFAHRNRKPMLTLDVESSVRADLPPQVVLRLALRDCRLTGSILHILGIDQWLHEGLLPKVLFTEVCDYSGLVIISGHVQWQMPSMPNTPPILWIDVPLPSRSQRHSLWQHYLADQQALPHINLEALTEYFEIGAGQIRLIVNQAKDRAAMRGETLQPHELFSIARAYTNAHLELIAHKITPRFGWNDLVVPQHQLTILREIVSVVRGRNRVLKEWGVGQKLASSSAVTMLFAGEPGTGKTMAAEVIGNDLELDIYKIDLSSLVSKYIGETEKNLEHIFSEAERSQAILFFDEADAVFGKRTGIQDAHDRYANIGVSYLLQRMEAYSGITILATNLRANLDEAFTRRIHFIVNFPFPEAEDRVRIWEALWPKGVPREPDVNFSYLAQHLKLAGGSIRNILVMACYLAANEGSAVHMRHLQHAARRELQKMGRIVQDNDLQAPVTRREPPSETPTNIKTKASHVYQSRPRK